MENFTVLSVLLVFLTHSYFPWNTGTGMSDPPTIHNMFKKSEQEFLTNEKGNIHIRTHFSLDNEWTGHHLMQHRSPASSAQSRLTMRHKQKLLHPLQKDTATPPSESRQGSRMGAELHRLVHPIPHPNHGGAPKPNAGTQQGQSPTAPLLVHSKDSN